VLLKTAHHHLPETWSKYQNNAYPYSLVYHNDIKTSEVVYSQQHSLCITLFDVSTMGLLVEHYKQRLAWLKVYCTLDIFSDFLEDVWVAMLA